MNFKKKLSFKRKTAMTYDTTALNFIKTLLRLKIIHEVPRVTNNNLLNQNITHYGLPGTSYRWISMMSRHNISPENRVVRWHSLPRVTKP